MLTVRGVDLTLAFPEALPIVAANLRLRASLDRLTADPYGSGWLFEARLPADEPPAGAPAIASAAAPPRAVDGGRGAARHRVVHARFSPGAARLAADGGASRPTCWTSSTARTILRLFAELFPLPDTRRTP